MARRVLIAVIALGMSPACGTPHSQLQRVILWQGEADCTACQAQAVTLWPNGPAGLTLKMNSVYTAQLELDAPGDPDRCVFQFASGTWDLPSRGFFCPLEQPVMPDAEHPALQLSAGRRLAADPGER
jgi:hypothetical protein